MIQRRISLFLCLVVCAAALGLAACATPKQPPLPVGNLKLGVAHFTQPNAPTDMLAGYVVENSPRIDQKVLSELDDRFATVLAGESKNKFKGRTEALKCVGKLGGKESGRTNTQAALRRWSAVGRCMGVDLLIVPQLQEFKEREGGDYGVASPATVVMDVFVIDVREETLISRSRFDETQSSLSSNLLNAGKFFKRGGKWLTAGDLATEGMVKAIKELGL